MNTYILTESRNFKTFFKETYAFALDNCSMFTKKNFEHRIDHDVDSTYGICIY